MKAILCTLAVVAAVALAANPVPPTFPLSWSAEEHIYVYETNGSQDMINQYSYWQQDSQFNRTAQVVVGTSGPTLVAVVTDYAQQLDYYIEGGLCQYTCTDYSEICNGQDSLCTYDYINGAKFAGTSKVNGVDTNVYQWMEGIGPIPMNELYLYVDAATNSKPVFQYRDLEPFGTYEGYINTTFLSFNATTPPASVFNVPGIQYCASGDGDQCPDSLAKRAWHQLKFLARAGAEAILNQMNKH